MKIRIGQVGISGYGVIHFEQVMRLVESGRADFCAAAVINPDQVPGQLAALKRLGTRIYSSAEAMFEAERGKLDLVCIPTGIASHESMTVQALECGANVLVEKPAAGSVAAVRRMMDAERKSGKFAAVGFQHIYAREVQFIKNLLVTGRLGAVRKAFCKGTWPRGDQYYSRNNWAGRRFAADGTPVFDSPVNNAFAHYLNLELFFSGVRFGESARAVSVEGMLLRARPEIETFDTCALHFKTENSVDIYTFLTHSTDVNRNPALRLECERGAVYWCADHGWNIRSQDGAVLHSGCVEEPRGCMFLDVADRLEGEPVFLCPLSVALEHTNCMELLSGTLTPVPVNAVRRETDGVYVLKNVAQVFDECFLNGTLPAPGEIR